MAPFSFHLALLFPSWHTNTMANGEEDLREKNKGRVQPVNKRYASWASHYGREDAEMLQEKYYATPKGKKNNAWHTYGED